MSEEVKSEQVAPLTADEAKKEALRQVEFYFDDANLPYDKFLFTLTRKDPEGWVPIATVASFKRMKAVRETIGLEGIVEVLKTSPELLEVDAAGEKVRRKKELVPVRDAYERSIYAKGFPDEYEALQVELEKFFAQFGKVNGVRMRRDMTSSERPKPFKHSVFVEFAEFETKDDFLKKAAEKEPTEDGGKGISFKERELVVMSKDAYCQMKMKEKGIDPLSAKRGSDSNKSSVPKKFNAFREMENESRFGSISKREGGRGGERAEQAPKTKVMEFDFNGKKLKTNEEGKVDPAEVVFPAQSVLKFTGAGEGGNWKDLKDTLVTVHPTSFVEFPAGAVEGAVGFRESLSDEKLDEIKAKNITVGGKPVEWARVDEETAKAFYIERAQFRATFLLESREKEASSSRNGGGFGGRGGGRGGRGGRGRGGRGGRGGGRGGFNRRDNADGGDKRKRDNDANADAPPTIGKKVKTEEASA
ncbi:hypothetical protein ACQY0O_001046 [Thecaphora frezii]